MEVGIINELIKVYGVETSMVGALAYLLYRLEKKVNDNGNSATQVAQAVAEGLVRLEKLIIDLRGDITQLKVESVAHQVNIENLKGYVHRYAYHPPQEDRKLK